MQFLLIHTPTLINYGVVAKRLIANIADFNFFEYET